MKLSAQQIEKLKEEREENEAKIEQLTHQNERLKAREQYLMKKERDGRTHRLCATGGIVESILPENIPLKVIPQTRDQFKTVSRQKKTEAPTNVSREIIRCAVELIEGCWSWTAPAAVPLPPAAAFWITC